MSHPHPDLERQPAPGASQCPVCGGNPAHDPEHVLSASGYLHDDVKFTCADCGHRWTCGVPIGAVEDAWAADLLCDSCEKRYGLVHRVDPKCGSPVVELHLKCPNQDCLYFWTVQREQGVDDRSTEAVALVGYPQITGQFQGAAWYGYGSDP